MYDDAMTMSMVPARPGGGRRRLVWSAAIVLVLLLAAGGALAALWPGPTGTGTPAAPAPSPSADPATGGTETPTGAIPLEAVPVALPAGGFPVDKPSANGPDNTGPGGGGSPPPADPCAGANEDLVGRPDPVRLNPGATKGSFDIHNCGSQTSSWQASTKPSVTLAATAGLLAAGQKKTLNFSFSMSSFTTSTFMFRIKLTGPDNTYYVEVHGSKLGGGGVIVAPTATTPPPGPQIAGHGPGCSVQCIAKAWLTARPGRSDLRLEVKTTVPARILATVGTAAPIEDTHGLPYLKNPKVSKSNGQQYVTTWTTTLSPLTASTHYHIVVRATDAHSGRSARTDDFTTAKRADDLAANEAGGCSAACVASAWVRPTEGQTNVELRVRTHVPATMKAYVSVKPVKTDAQGRPYFPDTPPAASTLANPLTDWRVSFQLVGATKYNIILVATDGEGRGDYRKGSFTTPPRPQRVDAVIVTFHRIRLWNDSDGKVNKGELDFVFDVEGQSTDRRSGKWAAPADIDLGSGRTVRVDGDPDSVAIRVQGRERDGAPTAWCPLTPAFFDGTAGETKIESCTYQFNTASVDLGLRETGGIRPHSCVGLGLTGDICHIVSATGHGPTFEVWVSVTLVD